MSIALNNRVRELELNVDQLKDMVSSMYKQIKDLTEKLDYKEKVNKK